MFAFAGPAYLVSVGYMDPGNWATDLEGGARFGYQLLWVITLSTLMLILLQHMAAHLGIQTGKCMPEAIREHFRPAARWVLGGTAMLACVATALAEVLGHSLDDPFDLARRHHGLFLEQPGAQVAFARIRQNGHDKLAGVVGP